MHTTIDNQVCYFANKTLGKVVNQHHLPELFIGVYHCIYQGLKSLRCIFSKSLMQSVYNFCPPRIHWQEQTIVSKKVEFSTPDT